VALNLKNQSRSRCPALGASCPPQARATLRLHSATDFVGVQARGPALSFLAHVLTREKKIAPRRALSPRRLSTQEQVRDDRARHNVLAFSCERT
jgi:hypothetical protein